MSQESGYAYTAMLVGLGLDTVPVQAREKCLKMAALPKYGWKVAHWGSQTNCERMVRAMRATRDWYLTHGIERGVNELDGAMHRLCSACGATLSALKP